ncbi:MAG TPA: CHAT domain-containing protein [Pyrinomonadaceae bacterium]|nr:CHAT domain-containing protein [Pyrinomonadaceae bacterium]
MALQPDDQKVIKQYLLGELETENLRRQVEERLLTDDDFFQELELYEDELVDLYLSDALTPGERVNFESHFLLSTEHRRKLGFARALRKYVVNATAEEESVAAKEEERPSQTLRAHHQPPFWTRLYSSPYLRTAAAFIVVLAVGLVIWRVFFYQSEARKGLIALARAYREERPIEARITAFSYARLVTTRGNEPSRVDRNSLNQAERLLFDAAQNEPGPASQHALGLLYISEGKFAPAIREFEEALKSDPRNAQIYSDLGAALLEMGKAERQNSERGNWLQDFAKSLGQLETALDLDNSLLPALFNRALCYQYMMQPQQAQDAWQLYLEQDASSQWAEEARQKLKQLEEQKSRGALNEEQLRQSFIRAYESGDDQSASRLLGQNYTSAGNSITNSLLDDYLDLQVRGLSDEAKAKLKALAYIAQLEVRGGDDHYTSDLVHFYSSVSPGQIPPLAQARQQMKKGYDLFIHSHYDDAIVNYSAAKEIFEQVGDESEAIFAQYRIAHCHELNPDIPESKSILDLVIPACERKHYKWLLAQALFGAAIVEQDLNEYSKAIDISNQALHLSEQVHDTNGVLKNLVQLADKYQTLNEPVKSLELLQRSLLLMNDTPVEPLQVWSTYITIAFNFDSLGFYTAALAYRKEALPLAVQMDRPLILSRNYEYLGQSYKSLKMVDEAVKSVERALEIGKSLPGEHGGLNMEAHSSLQFGDIYRESGDYAKSIKMYDQSIQLYDQLGFQYYSSAAHKGKLLSFLAQGNYPAAEEELKTVLNLFEQYRSKISEENNRDSFFDVEQSVYDLAIDFYSKGNNFQQAFEYSEQSRARSLLDIMLNGTQVLKQGYGTDLRLPEVSASASTLEQIQREMPEQSQIVQYAVLDNKILIWVVTNRELKPRMTEISAEALNQKVRQYLNGINSASESQSAETESLSRDLYSILIEPVEPLLDHNKLLCIVPDKILHYLPFGALISPASGRYLTEDYRLTLAPSSSIFLSCSEAARQRAGDIDERLLSVGDPSFDRAKFPSLPALPSAGTEAETIAGYYSSHELLLRENARESAVKSEIEQSDVVHLALHYVTDEDSSLLSKLVLAREEADASSGSEDTAGTIPAYEIYQMRLPRTRLVVLSACQTGIERHYRGEGPISIARPFIAASVPLVVASLWPVDSDATAELMKSFHKLRKHGSPRTAEALRQAQLEMIGNHTSRYSQPYYWASFIIIGGYAEF